MKQIVFQGNALEKLRDFPADARQEAGYQLSKVQLGGEPTNWKPMKSIGLGVREIRIRANDGAYRVIYVANFADVVHVLNAFEKKQQKTPKSELDIAKKYFGGIENG